MFTGQFLKATAERVVFVFAYTLITSLFVGAEVLDIKAIRWGEALSLAGGAAALALAKCLLASQVGVKGSPGLVRDPAAVEPDAERRPDPDGHVRRIERAEVEERIASHLPPPGQPRRSRPDG